MFDIGFSELILFGVIALIVLGPEKLPQAARTAGQWYAKIRRTVSTLQSEIEAELDLAETRQQMQKELAKIRQTEADMRREMAEIRGNMKEFEYSQNQNLKSSNATSNHDKYSNDEKPNSEQGNNPVITPKESDYKYGAYEQHKKTAETEPSSTLDAENHPKKLSSDELYQNTQAIQIINTKPWENMWFLLGAYDKARRLPRPPYLPNYKADTLLNAHLDKLSNKQASVNQQETD